MKSFTSRVKSLTPQVLTIWAILGMIFFLPDGLPFAFAVSCVSVGTPGNPNGYQELLRTDCVTPGTTEVDTGTSSTVTYTQPRCELFVELTLHILGTGCVTSWRRFHGSMGSWNQCNSDTARTGPFGPGTVSTSVAIDNTSYDMKIELWVADDDVNCEGCDPLLVFAAKGEC